LPETANWDLIGEFDQYDAEVEKVRVSDEDDSFEELLLLSN
jgi:hypothetical protein